MQRHQSLMAWSRLARPGCHGVWDMFVNMPSLYVIGVFEGYNLKSKYLKSTTILLFAVSNNKSQESLVLYLCLYSLPINRYMKVSTFKAPETLPC